MHDQLEIPYSARAHARADDPATSYVAACRAEHFASSHAGRIHTALLMHGPMTKDEIADRTGLSPVQVDRRLPDLKRAGKAMPEGSMRQSKAGVPERVWMAVQAAAEAA